MSLGHANTITGSKKESLMYWTASILLSVTVAIGRLSYFTRRSSDPHQSGSSLILPHNDDDDEHENDDDVIDGDKCKHSPS